MRALFFFASPDDEGLWLNDACTKLRIQLKDSYSGEAVASAAMNLTPLFNRLEDSTARIAHKAKFVGVEVQPFIRMSHITLWACTLRC